MDPMGHKVISIVLIFIICPFAFSQKEAYNWYFGNAGIDFNYSKPKALINSKMQADHGSASISTSNGRLLFYTDGETIWDSTHSIMPNGSGLNGNTQASQSALIIPKPNHPSIYFLFTVDRWGGSNGLRYNEISMKLNSGKGDIVPMLKNIPLLTPTCEKLTAVLHSNNKDYWVLTHKFNSDSIYAYLVTSSGVSTTPVISSTGLKISRYKNARGLMKVSPDRKKLVSINLAKDSSIIADFDPVTGKVHNPWRFPHDTTAISVEFSSKGAFLYMGDARNKQHYNIHQFNLRSKTIAQFLASDIIVDTLNDAPFMGFQIAPDGKIYIIDHALGSADLTVIHAPDSLGVSCRVQRSYLYLNGKGGLGLPTFIQSLFRQNNFNIIRNCKNDSTFFIVSHPNHLDSAIWDFGDTLSGKDNVSRSTSNIFHIYRKAGLYTAKLVYFYGYISDTISLSFTIRDSKLYLGKDTTFCNEFGKVLKPSVKYSTYLWNDNSKQNSLLVHEAGMYWLKAQDSAGCVFRDTIIIKNPSVKSDFLSSQNHSCNGKSVQFKDQSKIKNDSMYKNIWYIGDSIYVKNDTLLNVNFLGKGAYPVKLVSRSKFGCVDSITKIFNVYSSPIADFQVVVNSACLKRNSFDFINKSFVDSGNLNYDWDLGDISGFQIDYKNYIYKTTGKYKIRLICFTNEKCSDTSYNQIEVFENPVSDFDWMPACAMSPMQFSFTGIKPRAPAVTSFQWDFNGEASSKIENPSVIYKSSGTKKVGLILSTNNGCSDTIEKMITVKVKAFAKFDADDVCEDSFLLFRNYSEKAERYEWKLGDGNISNQEFPMHRYQIAGISTTFNVTLVAKVSEGCSDSLTKAVTVNANPVPDFTFTTSGNEVNFKASELNAKLYEWDFGDGITQNTSTRNIKYLYNKFPSGKYKACLKVTNLAGCISDTCHEINISGSSISISKESPLKIFPNPNNGQFSIYLAQPISNGIVEIYDAIGNMIYQNNIFKPITELRLDLSNGIYLLKLLKNQEVYTNKFIVTQK